MTVLRLVEGYVSRRDAQEAGDQIVDIIEHVIRGLAKGHGPVTAAELRALVQPAADVLVSALEKADDGFVARWRWLSIVHPEVIGNVAGRIEALLRRGFGGVVCERLGIVGLEKDTAMLLFRKQYMTALDQLFPAHAGRMLAMMSEVMRHLLSVDNWNGKWKAEVNAHAVWASFAFSQNPIQ